MFAFLTRRAGTLSKRSRIRPAASRRTALGVLPLEDRSVPSATAAGAFTVSDARIDASPAARDVMVRDVGDIDDLVINAVISGRGASAPRISNLAQKNQDIDVELERQLEIDPWSWGASRAGAQGGGGAGKVSMNDISFVAASTRSGQSGWVLASLGDASVRYIGDAIPTFTLLGTPPPKASDDVPISTVTLNFNSIQFPQNSAAAVDHPYALIGGKGALMSLGGINTWTGTLILNGTATVGATTGTHGASGGGGAGKVQMQDSHFGPASDGQGRILLGTDQGVWRASGGPVSSGFAFQTLTVGGSAHVYSDSINTPTALGATSPEASAGTTVQSGATLQVRGGLTVNEPLTLNGLNNHDTGALRNTSGDNISLNGLAAGTYYVKDYGFQGAT